MTNEQTAVLLLSIKQLIKAAESRALSVLPPESLDPNTASTAARVQQVFYDLEHHLWKQLMALGAPNVA